MLLDDRLATVLLAETAGPASARTQFRQLIDLLGSAPDVVEGDISRSAYHRLEELGQIIPPEEQSDILRTPGLRLRNRQIISFLAEGEAKPAAAALAMARLSDQEWQELIPELPILARGFLRHRRDLPEGASRVLSQLGVGDLVLSQPNQPQPELVEPELTEPDRPTKTAPPVPSATTAPLTENREAIGSLLRRIEAFRETRQSVRPNAPRLPLGDAPDDGVLGAIEQFEFISDAKGRINWASDDAAPMVVGMRLARPAPGVIAKLSDTAGRRMHLFQPLSNAPVTIDAAPPISGEWRIDADPVFATSDGRFSGYHGRIRRPVLPAQNEIALPANDSADRMRQLLHELRTPVNAIQGFAEIIQQQLFGPAPNEYRALAAGVAVDAAKLLASFDEVDRLARLETGTLELEDGDGDLREAVVQTIQRLESTMQRRGAGFDLAVKGAPFTCAVSRDDLMALMWRILASLGGNVAPAEQLKVNLTSDGQTITLRAQLPYSIAQQDDPFGVLPRDAKPVVSAGMFGSGFAFRLARAEAEAAGGRLTFKAHYLVVELPIAPPLLTDSDPEISTGDGDSSISGNQG